MKMLNITPDYSIAGNSTCLTLYKKRITKNGKEVWDATGYYNAGRYDHVLERLIDMEVGQLYTLEEIVKCCDNLKSWLREALKTIAENPSENDLATITSQMMDKGR